ncbi:MAG: VanW family protein [Firmicutes bacterium]|nr:VanW family protein [Bacillota bacterium]MDH7495844.1 VanW family protein [Bacillota bacterium]
MQTGLTIRGLRAANTAAVPVSAAVALVVVTLLTGTSLAYARDLAASPIAKGVSVADIPLGGLTREEATRALTRFVSDVVTLPITLVWEDQSWQLNPSDIGVEVDIPATVDRAMAIGRTGSWLARWRERRTVAASGRKIPLVTTVDEYLFRDILFELAAEIDVPAENAGFSIAPDDTVRIKPSVVGRRLDTSRLGAAIRDALLQREGRQVRLIVEPVAPQVTTEQLEAMRIKRCIGAYTTRFAPDDEARTHNIRSAAQAINGVLVAPGEVFSFNAAVGPRSKDTGYLEAPVVIEDELVPGVGGGICQVSSTLYNAVLLAGLEVVARANHSVAPAYVPVGRDATVAYDYIDFRFRNDAPGHVMVMSHVGRDSVTVKIYGDAPPDREVLIRTDIEEKLPPSVVRKEDPALAAGDEIVDDEGSWGYVVSVYRIIRIGGVEKAKELLSRDRYRPRARRVLVGSGAPRAPDLKASAIGREPNH